MEERGGRFGAVERVPRGVLALILDRAAGDSGRSLLALSLVCRYWFETVHARPEWRQLVHAHLVDESSTRRPHVKFWREHWSSDPSFFVAQRQMSCWNGWWHCTICMTCFPCHMESALCILCVACYWVMLPTGGLMACASLPCTVAHVCMPQPTVVVLQTVTPRERGRDKSSGPQRISLGSGCSMFRRFLQFISAQVMASYHLERLLTDDELEYLHVAPPRKIIMVEE